MASAGKNHRRSRKVVKSTYSKQIRVVRENWKVGERVSWDDLKSRFPEVFPSNGTSNIGRFFELARAKGDIDYDGVLKTSGVLGADSVVESRIQPGESRGSATEICDSGKITLVKPTDYGALRRALYTLGTALRPKEEVSASRLQARGAPFEEYSRGALGNFLVWLQARGELEPFNGKSRRLSARGFKEQTKMNPGKVQIPMLPVSVVPLLSSSFAHVDTPVEAPASSVALEEEMTLPKSEAIPVDVQSPVFEAVESTIVEPEKPKKARALPPIGIGDIPTGKDFSTQDRRCLGMLILSVVKTVGGVNSLINAKALYPQVRQLCRLGVEVKGNALGRFFYALYNLGLVESFGDRKDEGGYMYKVTEKVYQRVLQGEFGQLPLERFGIEVEEEEGVDGGACYEANEAEAPDESIDGVGAESTDVGAEAPLALVPEASEKTEVLPLNPSVISTGDKRSSSTWDLRRREQMDQKFKRLVQICERNQITFLSARTVRRVFREFGGYNTEAVLMVRIAQLASKGRIFRSSPEKGQGTYWFLEDYLKAVRSDHTIGADVASSVEVVNVPAEAVPTAGVEMLEAEPAGPSPVIAESEASSPEVEHSTESVLPTSSPRRVLVRRSAVVSRQIHDAKLAELRATRAAMEALQEQVEGLPTQLRDIVSEALCRQAEDFEHQLAEERGKRVVLQEQLTKLRREFSAWEAAQVDEGEAEASRLYQLEQRVMVLQKLVDRDPIK